MPQVWAVQGMPWGNMAKLCVLCMAQSRYLGRFFDVSTRTRFARIVVKFHGKNYGTVIP